MAWTLPSDLTAPSFPDGDTVVVLSSNHVHKLHGHVLGRNSSVLASLLTSDNASILSTQAVRNGETLRWRIDMTLNEAGQLAFVSGVSSSDTMTRVQHTNAT